MLQRLEFPDVFAELLALLEIVDGHVRGTGGDPDQFSRRTRAAGIESAG